MIFFQRLIFAALCLAFVVVVLGAYVRLSDAGLGCPDWPLCYGHISPHHAADKIAAAEAVQPGGPVSQPKAWKEMIHRYFAGTLGLLILSIAVMAWTQKRGHDAGSWAARTIVACRRISGPAGHVDRDRNAQTFGGYRPPDRRHDHAWSVDLAVA